MTDERQPDGRSDSPSPSPNPNPSPSPTPSDATTETTVNETATWQQPPSRTPPPIPPPANPQPPISPVIYPPTNPPTSWAPAPAPVAAARGSRTPFALVAGILLTVGGILGGLAALATLAFGNVIANTIEDLGPFPGLEGADTRDFVQGAIVFVGAFILICSMLYLAAGIGVLRSRDWGRILGITIGILGGLFWLPAVGSANVAGVRENLAGPLVFLAIHGYIALALLLAWRSRPAPG